MGEIDNAVELLRQYDHRMIDDPEPQRVLSEHYRLMGDKTKAIAGS